MSRKMKFMFPAIIKVSFTHMVSWCKNFKDLQLY